MKPTTSANTDVFPDVSIDSSRNDIYSVARTCYNLVELSKKTGLSKDKLRAISHNRKFYFKNRVCPSCGGPISHRATNIEECSGCRQ